MTDNQQKQRTAEPTHAVESELVLEPTVVAESTHEMEEAQERVSEPISEPSVEPTVVAEPPVEISTEDTTVMTAPEKTEIVPIAGAMLMSKLEAISTDLQQYVVRNTYNRCRVENAATASTLCEGSIAASISAVCTINMHNLGRRMCYFMIVYPNELSLLISRNSSLPVGPRP